MRVHFIIVRLSQSNRGKSMAKKLDKRVILPELAAAGPTIIAKIEGQVRRDDKLANITTIEEDTFYHQLKDAEAWSSINYELLSVSFHEPTVATAYDEIAGFQPSGGGSYTFADRRLSNEIGDAVRFLRTIVDRIALLNDLSGADSLADDAQGERLMPTPISSSTRKIFVVHGHDAAAKESVARFIGQLSLEPVILHEQPSEGQTIIEKFEKHADVLFAVVILSPDDVGHAKDKQADVQPRARQNVVFELGYFVARLGRHRVCALNKGEVEIPSDYGGVVYVPLDDAGAWKFALARDMKAAGFDLDLNKVF